jgi:hypothetical protein
MEIPAPTATETLESLPDEARVWVYPVARDLSGEEQDSVVESFQPFLDQWTSHGRRVHGAVVVLFARFIVVAATVNDGDISGCGVDASVHVLNPISQKLGFTICGPLDIHYKTAEGSIVSVSRLAFKQAADRGLVDGSTIVYSGDVETLGQLRTGGLERTVRDSWHARAFGVS